MELENYFYYGAFFDNSYTKVTKLPSNVIIILQKTYVLLRLQIMIIPEHIIICFETNFCTSYNYILEINCIYK